MVNMSPRQWLALFFFYISYLLFGASIFYHIERDLEVHKIGEELQRRIDVNGKIKSNSYINIYRVMENNGRWMEYATNQSMQRNTCRLFSIETHLN